jgi:hypothetical protein
MLLGVGPRPGLIATLPNRAARCRITFAEPLAIAALSAALTPKRWR